MFKQMLCGVVVMTASILGMEQEKKSPHIQMIVPACLCANLYCQGPLPHATVCMRVGRHQSWPRHDDPRYSWKRLSGERPYPAHDEVRRD